MAKDVTQLLIDWGHGDPEALGRLMPLVTDELRQLARKHLASERPDHTLQPTALVNEAYLRLVDLDRVRLESRLHFFSFTARLMRQILVDHARARLAAKRGGGVTLLSLDEADGLAEPAPVDVLALNDALERLRRLDEVQGQIVELRYFAGLTFEEIARVLSLTTVTAFRRFASAKAWLFRELRRR